MGTKLIKAGQSLYGLRVKEVQQLQKCTTSGYIVPGHRDEALHYFTISLNKLAHLMTFSREDSSVGVPYATLTARRAAVNR